jgi:hypothetical protein
MSIVVVKAVVEERKKRRWRRGGWHGRMRQREDERRLDVEGER